MKITISDEAANMILDTIEANEFQNPYLEIEVVGGGCSGLKYRMGLSEYEELDLDSIVVESMGVKILTSKHSSRYLDGAEINYISSGALEGFKIENPNAVKSCGCGESFSVDGEAHDTCGGCGYS